MTRITRQVPDLSRSRVRTWWARIRKVLGWSLLVVSGLALVLYVLGTWNPANLVVLEYRFGNPVRGALYVTLGAFVGQWLAFPVRIEAIQQTRLGIRLAAGLLALVAFGAHQIFNPSVSYDVEVVAESADGSRVLVDVRDREIPPNSYLRVWTGTGLFAREVGEVGRVCGGWDAEMDGNDRIVLHPTYSSEPWLIDLDPETGVPLQRLGSGCADGPVPATLGQ